MTLRIIVEHRTEWQSIDMKAFDSVGREVLWKLFQHYEIPVKTVPIVRGGLQGFLVTLDWLSRTVFARRCGIQWSRPEDPGFADDLALMSNRIQNMKDITCALGEQREGWPEDYCHKYKKGAKKCDESCDDCGIAD